MNVQPHLFWQVALGRCPRCAATLPKAPPWNVAPQCGHCALILRRPGGFFLGALVWNYGLIAFGYLPLLLIPGLLGWVGWKPLVWAAVIGGLVLPWLIHGLAWRLWIGTYYTWLPEQLGKRTDD